VTNADRPTITVYTTDHEPPQPHIRVDRPGMEARSAPIEDGRALIDAIAGAFGWSVTIDRADPTPPQVDHPQTPDADSAG
jgi:hypothetical protein